jgi:hypothetical protein
MDDDTIDMKDIKHKSGNEDIIIIGKKSLKEEKKKMSTRC